MYGIFTLNIRRNFQLVAECIKWVIEAAQVDKETRPAAAVGTWKGRVREFQNPKLTEIFGEIVSP